MLLTFWAYHKRFKQQKLMLLSGTEQMFIATEHNLTKVQDVLVDFGYSGEKFAVAIKQILGCGFEVACKK